MTNFTNTNKTKGVLMNREQKANRTSIPNTGLAAKLSNPTRVEGTGAPISRRAPIALIAVLATVAGLAFTAAPASAAPQAKTPVLSNPSYGSVHVEAEADVDGFGEAIVQYSTNETDWKTGFAVPDFDFGSGLFPVKGDIKGLKGATTYFVRVRATFGFGGEEVLSPGPNPSFTTLAADPPSVETTDNASEVSYTTAKLTGKVIRPVKSDDLKCDFEYITDDAYLANPVGDRFSGATPIACDPSPVATVGSSSVSAKLTGLANATTYHLRLKVSGAGGEDAKEALSPFTTLTVDPPSVKSIENAAEVEYTQVQVKGVVERPATSPDPAFDVTCNFEYVTDDQFNANDPGERFAGATPVVCEPEAKPAENPITATGPRPVKATLGGLSASTTYHLRLSASNQGGSDAKEAATFATAGPVPKPTVIAANDATDVSFYTAKVSGEIERPAGADPTLDVNCRFEYITDQLFDENVGNSAPPFEGASPAYCPEPITSPDPGHPAVSAPVSVELSGLKDDTTYHLRLVAENGGGTDIEEASTFTTVKAKPITATVNSIDEVGYATAHVSYTFDRGDTPGGVWGLQYAPADTENWFGDINWVNEGNFSADAACIRSVNPNLWEQCTNPNYLKPGTTYKMRMVVRPYLEGGEFTSTQPYPEFTTKGTSTPPSGTFSIGDVTGTTAHFSGTVDTHAPAEVLNDEGKAAYRTEWRIECVPECNNANGNPISGTVEAEGSGAISGDAVRLEPDTHYEQVKLIVKNVLATVETPAQSFETLEIPPSVKLAQGASDGTGGYTLQGLVNPNNQALTDCSFKWGPNSNELVFSVDCSPLLPNPGAKPTTVEAHLTGLTADAAYYSQLVVKYGAGLEEDSGSPQEFKPTFTAKEPCPANEQLRIENSSLALPECRAYELVTPPGKEGFDAVLSEFSGGERVFYTSGAGNIARSGQSALLGNQYVAARTETGWETIPNLNGSSGSIFDAPSEISPTGRPSDGFTYSADLLTSQWVFRRNGDSGYNFYLRNLDGTFTLIGPALTESSDPGAINQPATVNPTDLSHVFISSESSTAFGPGVYEYVGTGNDQPRRVDVDNSSMSITTCKLPTQNGQGSSASKVFNSSDGRVVVFKVAGGCGGANPPATEIWARIGGTTSFDVSASHCDRVAPACSAPADATFAVATPDGSRIFFTTTQQLVNADTDQTNDIYGCDLPTGNPAPSAGKANHCAAFRQVSGARTGATVERVLTNILSRSTVSAGGVSEDGSTVSYIAKGSLVDNKDALGEQAVAGDHNLYVWRTDADHPNGQTFFVGRLDTDDVLNPQATPDGRYLVFTTASRLLETDTDNARDVYRFEADTGKLTRASTNVFGVAGNGDFASSVGTATGNHPSSSISDDGQKIVFVTTEALSPADGNAEPDVYLWTPARVALITTGSIKGGLSLIAGPNTLVVPVSIDGSGQNIYFQTPGALTPADGDDIVDVYDARIGGGFSFAPPSICTGEKCQPDATPPPPKNAPLSARPGPGNPPQPKPCPKGKVRNKKGRCVKKHKKHHKKSHKKAGHNRGVSK